MDRSGFDEEFTVLFVCTGNICRSPIAEQLFRAQTTGLASFVTASSAGTLAVSGQDMTHQAKTLSSLYGGDPSQHQASEVTLDRIRRANLIVTMAREHRAAVVSTFPRASRKTFTLRELDRLIATFRELEPERSVLPRGASATALDLFVRDVAAMRGFSSVAVSLEDDDIVDPYHRGQEIYDVAGSLISGSISRVANALKSVASSGLLSGGDGASPYERIVQDQGLDAQQQRWNDD